MDRAQEARLVQKRSFYEDFVADDNDNEEIAKPHGINPNTKRSKTAPNEITTRAEPVRQQLYERQPEMVSPQEAIDRVRFRKAREASMRLWNIINDDDANNSNQYGIRRNENLTPPIALRPMPKNVEGISNPSFLNQEEQIGSNSDLNAAIKARPTSQTDARTWMLRDTRATSPDSQVSNSDPMEDLEHSEEPLGQQQLLQEASAYQNWKPVSNLALQVQESTLVDSPKSFDSSATTPNMTQCTTFNDYVKIQKQKKQKDLIRLVPGNQRIFHGFYFFFIPNDEVAKHRRDRIRKSLEHGATWAKEFASFVTHIIADKDLSFSDIAKYLQLEQMPSTMYILKDSYIPWCLQWRQAMDPSGTMHELRPSPGTNSQQASLLLNSPTQAMYTPVPPDTVLRFAPGNDLSKHVQCEESLVREASDPLADVAELAKIEQTFQLNSDEEGDDCGSGRACKTVQERSATDETHDNKPSESTESWQKSFSCMYGGSAASNTELPNVGTINMLQQMLTYYESTNDQWRVIAYRKAISALKRQEIQITTKAEAEKISGIGTSIATKIEEIVFTNRLRKLDAVKDDPAAHALSIFLDIYGVGYKQASRWVQKGHRTIDDIVEFETLTENQKVGVAHFDDFRMRIPRAEVEECGRTVSSVLQSIDSEFTVLISGSYRRGSSESGDIDLIITRPGKDMNYIRTSVHGRLVPLLYKQGFLTATLADMSKESSSKWHGACQLPLPAEEDAMVDAPNTNPWRRIDFLLVPPEEYGAALLYFTGNDIFNRSMRLLARKKGMCLNQHGLFKGVVRSSDQVKLSSGVLIESRSEQRIFEILGVPWREPHQRIC